MIEIEMKMKMGIQMNEMTAQPIEMVGHKLR